MMTAAAFETSAATEDDQYHQLLACIRVRFAEATAGQTTLFTTTTENPFRVFLDALPVDRRQHYTCNACRRFVDRFGGLVTVDRDGNMTPVLWDPETAPPFFRASVRAVSRAVARAKIDGVFLTEEKTWGLPQNKSDKPPFLWKHIAVAPPPALVFKPTVLQTAGQKSAERREEHGMLCRGLAEFPIDVVQQAHTLLTTGQLYRSEKCIGVAKWLLDLHEAREATKNTAARDNLAWLAVASAPAGFCHVRSGMIGTLLEDIVAKLAFADIKAKFDAKMNPLIYQRPQTAPSAGNIAQAEKIVQALAAAGALDRRFARLEDVVALWTPKQAKLDAPPSGVFSHLKPREAVAAPQIEAPPVTMTWEKFARTVLPDAEQIEFYASARRASYVTMVTASNPSAPPILQWDREEQRNPVSWYFYHGGSTPGEHNLAANAWHPVTAITLKPPMWHGGDFSHQGDAAFFLIRGSRDTRYTRGAAFFPECLRSEYHGVRKTMEAYAQAATIEGAADASACGIALQKGVAWDCLFRVTSKGTRVTYKLDRWD